MSIQPSSPKLSVCVLTATYHKRNSVAAHNLIGLLVLDLQQKLDKSKYYRWSCALATQNNARNGCETAKCFLGLQFISKRWQQTTSIQKVRQPGRHSRALKRVSIKYLRLFLPSLSDSRIWKLSSESVAKQCQESLLHGAAIISRNVLRCFGIASFRTARQCFQSRQG